MQQDRYCRSCGQELRAEDQFCANCGRPVHATAHVPTPEADVSVPPPEQAEDRSVPSQAPHTRPGAGRVHTAPSIVGPVWGMGAVFLVELVVVTVQEMPAAPPGKDLGDQISYQIATGMALAISALIATAAIILVVGAIYYAISRKRGVTFREAVFNWPMVILAGLATSGSFL
jgi:hypothetical protein